MSVQCQVKGVSTRIMKFAKLYGKRTLFFSTVFVLCLAIAAESASAIGTTKASGFILKSEDLSSLQPSPSVGQDDTCLPLLKKVRHNPSVSSMDPSRRPAGHKAAAVGFVLGFRIALGPTEVTGQDRVSVGPEIITNRDSRSLHALAVADYRACKNNQALQRLKDDTR